MNLSFLKEGNFWPEAYRIRAYVSVEYPRNVGQHFHRCVQVQEEVFLA